MNRKRTNLWVIAGLALWWTVVAGCGSPERRTVVSPDPEAASTTASSRSATKSKSSTGTGATSPDPLPQPAPKSTRKTAKKTGTGKDPYGGNPVQSPNLGGLLKEAKDHPQTEPAAGRPYKRLPATEVSPEVVRGMGLRKLSGKHLTLYTDLPSSPAVDELPVVFDRAFAHWCEYFGVDAEKNAQWRMTGLLMKDKERFRQSPLLPAGLPDFPNGYSRGLWLWMVDQTEPYYRRHLLLHEGTHGFMNTMLGGCGGPWYMEGIAEHLATHQWDGRRLVMRHFPRTRRDCPGWGRIKYVKDGLATGRLMLLEQLFKYDNRRHQPDAYGWCWAAAAFLDGHPRYQRKFRQVYKVADLDEFNARFIDLFREDYVELTQEFVLFVTSLEYGYDVARNAIDFAPGEPLAESGKTVEISADRGWQPSGVRLEAGRTYRLTARGRYQVAHTTRPWISEPGGVSIRYYGGRPLGIVLAALYTPEVAGGVAGFLKPVVVGQGTTVTPERNSTLYLRVNDTPAELSDNAGTVMVEVRRQ